MNKHSSALPYSLKWLVRKAKMTNSLSVEKKRNIPQQAECNYDDFVLLQDLIV